IAVDPGPRFVFGTAVVAPLAPGTELPENFAPGATARSDTIRAAASSAVSAWRDVGHAKAETGTQSIVALHQENRLDAEVEIRPGPRLTYGPLTIQGNDTVRAERIAALAALEPGKVFSPADLDAAALRLRRTGTFRSVTIIEGETFSDDFRLPMTIQVSELPPRRFGFGAELSSTEGLSLNAFWLHRNLLGGMERFRVEGAITGIEGVAIDSGRAGPDYRLGFELARPGTFNPDIDLLATLAISRLDEPDFRLDQVTGTLGFTQFLRDDLTYKAGIGFLTAREETAFRRRDYTLLTLPLEGILDRRDDPLNATEGFFIDLQVTPFLGVIGAGDGVRVFADGRGYFSFGERVTLAARGQIGSVLGPDLLDAPADFLFYSGGGGTVRGQPYQALGIELLRIGFDDGSSRIGGRSFAGVQLETRVGITDALGAVAFYDIGAIDIENLPGEGALWHAGVGLGVRYNTPIGPIRLDVATPASDGRLGDRVEFYVGIGQAF
ncbi:MAG: BamA/TamA family outer membrane protein, partial [Rubellimicrobium sp.]|nr:BamA/TamA family outer membrane protein [Rubellimicrobium sp.]